MAFLGKNTTSNWWPRVAIGGQVLELNYDNHSNRHPVHEQFLTKWMDMVENMDEKNAKKLKKIRSPPNLCFDLKIEYRHVGIFLPIPKCDGNSDVISIRRCPPKRREVDVL